MAGSALIGSLAVNLSLETAAFQQGANIAEKRATALGKKMQDVGAKMAKVGAVMSVGITAPLLAFGKGAFQAATDAAEMESAFAVSFGNSAAAVRQWAEETGDAMGRSTQELMTMSASFQDILKKSMDPAAAAEMSKQMTVLTQDLASFKNLSNDVAQQKIFSGLIGEAEPLRAVGVLLSDTAVKAKALQMGLMGANNELTEGEKVQARAALIMEQLSDAQGDVMRTSDSTANQLKRSAAAWEELQVTIGTKLLPVLTPIIEKFADVLTLFSKLSPTTQTWVVGIGAAAAAAGPFVTVIGGIVNIGGKLLPLLLKLGPAVSVLGKALLFIAANPLILGLAAVIGGIYLAWKNWDKITAIVQRVYQGVKTWLQDKMQSIFNWVGSKVDWVRDKFQWLGDQLVFNSIVPDMVDQIGEHMARLDELMVQPVKDATDKAAVAFQELSGRVQGLLGQLYPEQARDNQFLRDLADIEEYAKKAGWAVGMLDETIGRLAAKVYPDEMRNGALAAINMASPGAVRNGEAKPIEAVKEEIKEATKAGRTFIDVLKEISDPIQRIGDLAGGVFSRFADLMVNNTIPLIEILHSKTATLTEKLQGFSGLFQRFGDMIGGKVAEWADAITNAVIPAIETMMDKTAEAKDKVAALGNAFSSLFGLVFGRKTGGILGAIAQIGMSVAGIFLKKPAAGAVGMARGGSGTFGGLSGIDRNVLSLNGTPIARVSKGEHFSVSPANSNAARVTIVPTPYFDAHVDGRAVRVAAPMAGQAALVGASGGVSAVAKRTDRNLYTGRR